ncbi:MAG TPA: tRNA 2-thiouridine(34) synthase MnmA [Actinomycetota bacterium]|nr:tRNA 2-thiouridine(34) synthase MnmA [Actinomycetota bacterium]
MKVLVAMSGGVDSSVAAAIVARDGHDVTGVHMKLSSYATSSESDGRVHGCCTVEAADDARRVAQVLDIPFYVWNLTEEFSRGVLDDFVSEYAGGRTPNPCVRCNETVKFGALLERGRAAGFDAVATGHYAVSRFEGDTWRMYRSADHAKDQSYVLSTIGQEALSFARFPIGAQTKDETRALARSLKLRTADKPDSYEICFVPDGDAAGFVERFAEPGSIPAGEIVDADGTVLGGHGGVHRYTVGQRRGLGLGLAEKRYVVEVDATANRVIVGTGELLARGGLEAGRVTWFGEAPSGGTTATVQIRAHGAAIPATLEAVDPDRTIVRFAQPQRGIAPGQLVAFYDGDEVLGGGTITRSLR